MNLLRIAAAMCLTAIVATGCAEQQQDEPDGSALELQKVNPNDIQAIVASYDLAADVDDQSVKIGVLTGDGQVLSYGTVSLTFSYLGSRDKPKPAVTGPTATAAWSPIAGEEPAPPNAATELVKPSDATGIYIADAVRFDDPGFWEVEVSATVDGEVRKAKAALEVSESRKVIGPGQAAPPVENHITPGGDITPASIDSRATSDDPIPDPELHALTVKDALATGKPTMVVISTPVYCVSRFCGPITDSVQRLAGKYGDRMQFIHIEVWRDFQAKQMNKAAAEWIYPPGAEDVFEPWVFVVDDQGVIVERLDNAVSDAHLEAAIQRAIQ